MNGIIHNCTHGEDLDVLPVTHEQMFKNIADYLDRLIHVVRPRNLVYMAIDGVAPRAKMNQQRSRRFRAAQEREESQNAEEEFRAEIKAQGLKLPPKKAESFDHNVITPGTLFFAECVKFLRFYIHDRITNRHGFKNLKIILSDANSPGEGEHKVNFLILFFFLCIYSLILINYYVTAHVISSFTTCSTWIQS